MKDQQTGSYWSDWGIEAIGVDTSEDGVVIYTYPGGWKRRVKANRPVRNNNPGNLKFSSDQKAREAGALGRDKKGFGVFPDWMTGKRAADRLWDSYRKDKSITIGGATQKYTETGQEKRIKDLIDKAAGWVDKDGKPVTENTPLSKLTDEQFSILRDYGSLQLEGWLNGLHEFSNPDLATSEWIQTPGGARTPAGASTRQPPAGRVPAPNIPAQPHSSLEAPATPYRPASLDTGTLGPPESMAVGNRFSSPDMPRGYATQFADPFAQYPGGGSSPVTENPYVPGQGGPARPNLLDSPSSFDSFTFGSGTQPQLSPQPSGQERAKNQVKPGQTKKAPFYSLQDRLDFLGRVYRVAKPVSEAAGLSLPFILAHAAHEVQFGKNITENNLFNLKADKDWQGSTHLKGGNEYRSYPSYEASMKDYLTYLQGNPRYAKMFEPVTRGSLGTLADAIHHAGYSDDPLYTFRILAAAKDPIMKQALWQYQHWPP
jgi:hypothetical protein